MSDTKKRWTLIAASMLEGKTIQAVRYLTDVEMSDLGWYKNPIVIFFTDDTYIFPSMDDEGNDGGALFTSNEDNPIIPVIS